MSEIKTETPGWGGEENLVEPEEPKPNGGTQTAGYLPEKLPEKLLEYRRQTAEKTMEQRLAALEQEIARLHEHLRRAGDEQTRLGREQMERQTRFSALQLAIQARGPGADGETTAKTAEVFLSWLRQTEAAG